MNAAIVIDGYSLATFDDEAEPRLRDTDLAERLGYDKPRSIRKLIERNRPEIEQFGAIQTRSTVERVAREGRGTVEIEAVEFWLTFDQAMLVAVLSRTERASDVRVALVSLASKVRRRELASATPSAGLSLEAARELGRSIVEPILAQYAQHAGRVDAKLDEHGTRLARLEASVDKVARGRRREITATTKAVHTRAVRLFGALCPCCAMVRVVDDEGRKVDSAQFDHFFAAQAPDIDHTWLICKGCHDDFTYSRVRRDERTSEFSGYQARRRRLPNAQLSLLERVK